MTGVQTCALPIYLRFRVEAIGLFQELVKQGKGFDEAIEAASQAIKYDNVKLRKDSMALFQELLKQQGLIRTLMRRLWG